MIIGVLIYLFIGMLLCWHHAYRTKQVNKKAFDDCGVEFPFPLHAMCFYILAALFWPLSVDMLIDVRDYREVVKK